MRAKGAEVAPGDLIDGRYLVEAHLGSGGMAVVHRVRHTGTGALAALKLVHPHLVPKPELVDLFLREARVGGRVGKSPHVVQILDAGLDAERGVPYFVMELLTGETLEHALSRGPLSPLVVRVVFDQLADALDQAHAAGVVHRDLKPSNLFLTEGRRGQPCVKVMDFGIAKVLEGDAHRTATQIGTPAYAAPEQMGPALREAASRQGIVVAPVVSPATDVWALGLLAYELLTGLPASQYWGVETTAEIPVKAVLFTHEPATARAGDRAGLLPPGFDPWFERATHANAAARWPSAGAAVDELVRILDAFAPPDALPDATPAPAPRQEPQVTEVTAGAPARKAAPIAWAGRTPPPGAVRPTRPDGPGVAEAHRAPARRTWPIYLTSALLALLLVGVAGAVILRPKPRPAPLATDACRASGERCDEACTGGDFASCALLAARCESGAGVPRDEARAARLYDQACSGGDLFGCAGLGRMIRFGRGGMTRDPARAVSLFQRACDGGAERGCARLGEAYRDGVGALVRDDVRAVALFQRACDGGDMLGCKDLGHMHQHGRGGLDKDEVQAVELYRRACDGGEMLGCNSLAWMFERGRGGLEKDEAQAADGYRRACDGGERLGCDNLAWMIEHGKGGLEKDEAQAEALYRASCEAGDALGCGNLGVMVEHGRGGIPGDDAGAAALYDKACSGGDMGACDHLGILYEYARGGLARDDARAVALYQRACDAGEMRGCKDLAYMHENGRGGLARDDARAARLYERACGGDELQACANLGVLLAFGRGGPRDEGRAAALWKRACDGGNAAGCAYLGWAHLSGRGVPRDRGRALELLRKGCEGGSAWGCERLHEADPATR